MTNPITTFADRHIGPNLADKRAMLAALGVPSVETLIAQAVPKSIRLGRPLDLPEPASEAAALAELAAKMSANKVMKSFVGAGFHGVIVPPVIQRNLFENPAWYTAYTPYQSEISQGRLELLFHFQTLVAELTGLPVASASLLDEASAVAEAVGIAWRHHREKRSRVVLAGALHPHIRDVVETRGEPLAITIDEGAIDETVAAVIVPWPDTFGVYRDHGAAIDKAKAAGALVIFVADPLALVRRPPAGRARRRHRGRRHAALRRADGFRRPARRLLRGVRQAHAADARPPGRPVGRQQGPPRLPAGAADARAAHPPRQGDLQHLHGAGAARQHGDRLCDLARARGAAGDRRACRMASPRGLPRGSRRPASRSPATASSTL